MPTVRTPFVIAVCLGFLMGVTLASFAYTASYTPPWTFVAATVVLVTAAVWRFDHRHRAIVCCFLVAVGVGVIRFGAIADASEHDSVMSNRDVTLEGRVGAVTPLTQGRSRLQITDACTVATRRGDVPEVRFRRSIIVFASANTSAEYGDIVQIRCRFTTPQRLGDRLTVDGVCSARDPGDIRVLATGGGSPTFRLLARTRRELSARIDRSLAQPASGVVQSMVLGIPHAVGIDLEEAFRRSGTIHILVVSGWHMSYIADRLRRVLLSIGIPRGVSLRVAIACVIAFTLLVGLTAPAVRGCLVAVALAFVGLIGRVANPLRVLLVVATAMVAVHPHILGFDLAFQLTIVATAAILLAAPIMERLFPCRRPFLRELRDLLGASIAASLATAPLLMSAFGVVALLGPFIGIVVLPLSAAVIPVSVILLAVSVFLPFMVPPIAWATTALTNAIVRLVEWGAALPWAQLTAPRLDGWFIAGIYLLASVAILRWYRHREISMFSPFAFTTARKSR